jgi:early secretory antigenic target protein ESAT-6
MNDGPIKVSFGELSSAASDITGQANTIQSQLDELKQRLAPMIAQWEGAASGSYQDAQRRWDTAAEDLQRVLASVGTAVAQASDAYAQAEQQNASRWG